MEAENEVKEQKEYIKKVKEINKNKKPKYRTKRIYQKSKRNK